MARRYFVDPLPPPGAATLLGDAAHHLGHVLRAAPGDALVLCDGRGRESRARVVGSARAGLTVAVEPATAVPPPRLHVHLAFAPPRWTRAEWLLEHGTEVGVAVFQPLCTEHSRPQGERAERWRRLVRAAAGQCDRAWLPEVRPVRTLPEWLAEPELPRDRRLAQAGAAPPAAAAAGEVALLVGPEGGFAAAETALLAARGFVPVGLGPHVLRTETAALVGAALLLAGGTAG